MEACGGSAQVCVKCEKAIKRSETVLVCGLWCRKSYHNDCLGLSRSEALVVTRSKVRIKFHCEACEKRLGTEFFGEDTREPKRLDNCVNNCVTLLALVQNLVKLTNELSNSNLAINTKLDTVLRSNERLEESLLQSPKGAEKGSVENPDSVGHVENNSAKRTTEICERNDDTDSLSDNINSNQVECCASEHQQTDNSLRTESDFTEQVADSQPQNVAEGCCSNGLQEWEVPDGHDSTQAPQSTDKECVQEWEELGGHNSMQDPLSTIKVESSPAEDFLVSRTFSIKKAEDEGDEEEPVKEEAMREDDGEECASLEDILVSKTFRIEKAEDEGDEEEPVREEAMREDDGENLSSPEDSLHPSSLNVEMTDNEEEGEATSEDDFEEVKHEVELTSSDCKPESSIHVGVEGSKNTDDSGDLVTHVSLAPRRGNRTQYTNMEEASQQKKVGTRYLGHRCDICKKTFTRLQQLKKHTHVDRCELMHSCSVCHKTFRHTSHLKDHLRVHTGERPFSCIVCNKRFTQNSGLKSHSLLHTGERPYSCSICKKTFKQKSHLTRHSRVHTGERPYSCAVCHKSFSYATQMKEHSRLHTGERPYSCNICGKKFSYRTSFRYHMLHHKRKCTYT